MLQKDDSAQWRGCDAGWVVVGVGGRIGRGPRGGEVGAEGVSSLSKKGNHTG